MPVINVDIEDEVKKYTEGFLPALIAYERLKKASYDSKGAEQTVPVLETEVPKELYTGEGRGPLEQKYGALVNNGAYNDVIAWVKYMINDMESFSRTNKLASLTRVDHYNRASNELQNHLDFYETLGVVIKDLTKVTGTGA